MTNPYDSQITNSQISLIQSCFDNYRNEKLLCGIVEIHRILKANNLIFPETEKQISKSFNKTSKMSDADYSVELKRLVVIDFFEQVPNGQTIFEFING